MAKYTVFRSMKSILCAGHRWLVRMLVFPSLLDTSLSQCLHLPPTDFANWLGWGGGCYLLETTRKSYTDVWSEHIEKSRQEIFQIKIRIVHYMVQWHYILNYRPCSQMSEQCKIILIGASGIRFPDIPWWRTRITLSVVNHVEDHAHVGGSYSALMMSMPLIDFCLFWCGKCKPLLTTRWGFTPLLEFAHCSIS